SPHRFSRFHLVSRYLVSQMCHGRRSSLIVFDLGDGEVAERPRAPVFFPNGGIELRHGAAHRLMERAEIPIGAAPVVQHEPLRHRADPRRLRAASSAVPWWSYQPHTPTVSTPASARYSSRTGHRAQTAFAWATRSVSTPRSGIHGSWR